MDFEVWMKQYYIYFECFFCFLAYHNNGFRHPYNTETVETVLLNNLILYFISLFEM